MQENWYDRHILPWLLDVLCGLAAIARQRQRLVPLARGRVLEIGIGTGLNMPFYDADRVSSIVGVDPALRMHRLARSRILRAGLKVELVGLSAEKLPLPDASFDTVLVTYTLCSIPDPVSALKEMRRVLAPGGQLLFCEHGRAPDEAVRRWQARLQPAWQCMAGGCQLGRDIPALLEQAGFVVRQMDARYLKGPRPLTYNFRGEAVAAVAPVAVPGTV
jgi:ubiquinone/menaquinone biosynthesis C-methylase UbiE